MLSFPSKPVRRHRPSQSYPVGTSSKPEHHVIIQHPQDQWVHHLSHLHNLNEASSDVNSSIVGLCWTSSYFAIFEGPEGQLQHGPSSSSFSSCSSTLSKMQLLERGIQPGFLVHRTRLRKTGEGSSHETSEPKSPRYRRGGSASRLTALKLDAGDGRTLRNHLASLSSPWPCHSAAASRCSVLLYSLKQTDTTGQLCLNSATWNSLAFTVGITGYLH